MKNWKKIEDTLSDLFEKRERANDLHKQLEHSLALQKLCPIAFEHGTCKAGWRTDENRKPIFEIVRADGSTITFPFDEVPDTFKLEEAAKREITGIRRPHFHKTSFNGPIGKALIDFMEERRLKQKKQRRGERDD